MMHHPSSQYGSNLKNQPEPDPYPPSQHPTQNQPDPYDSYDSTFSPKGNVAALRNVIHGQLDMKTPSGGTKRVQDSSIYQKPAPPPVDPTPSWAKNVKVYEPNGYVDPHLNKHNMGRVLDGPVNPTKFFQGVPPPSYSQVKPGTETKPPAPPTSKPPIQQQQPHQPHQHQTQAQALQAQVLQNESAAQNPVYSSSKPPSDPYRPAQKSTSYRIPYDVSIDPRHHYAGGGEFDIDDSASIISSSYTFGDSSEIAAFSAAAEQRHLYEQYRKKLEEEKHELKEGSETPCVSLAEKAPVEEPTTVPRSIFETDLTPFGQAPVAQVAPMAPKVAEPSYSAQASQNASDGSPKFTGGAQGSPKFGTVPSSYQKSEGSPKTNPFATPSPNPFANYSPASSTTSEQKRSIDLESSQLLVKPKSPAPYSTSSSDHYGTIRRKYKPVAIEIAEGGVKGSPKVSPMFFGSGFEEKAKNRSPLTPSSSSNSGVMFKDSGFGKSDSLNDSLNQAFEIASSIESTKNNYEAPPTPKSMVTTNAPDRSISDTYPVSIPQQQPQNWPPSMDTSTTTTTTSTTVKEPDSMSSSMNMSTSALPPTNMDESIVYGQQAGEKSPDSSPDRHEDMSQWYRKMFKQMHKKGEDPLVDRKQEQDRFLDNNNRSSLENQHRQGNLRRSQESLSRQSRTSASPRAQDSTSTRFDFENFEHGPLDAQNYGQEQRLGQKQQSNEDELLRLKAEKLAEELKKEKERKHGFVPSATPSLQNNMDRLNSLLYDFSSDAPEQQNYHPHQQQQAVVTATAVYKFEPRSARELPLNRGDIVRIIRDVDAYWMEGERNGRCGIFPNSYVQINSGSQSDSQKMRAIYPFTARSDTELSLKRGEIITRRRQIDSNWLEGSNQIGIVGIFPASYVEPLEHHEPIAPVSNVFPHRPKTPKIEDTQQVFNPYNQQQQGQQGYSSQKDYGQRDLQQVQYPQEGYQREQQPVTTVVPNNKVRFDLPSGSDSSLQMTSVIPHSQNIPIHIQHHQHQHQNQIPIQSQTQNQQPNYGGGMKRIEYDREPQQQQIAQKLVDEEPILEQYRKLNDETPKGKKENTNILMNAASLIPKGSEMYRAVYPYQPQKDDELQLFTNDIIFVVEKCDDGWYIGTSLRTGEFGIFPGNYVKRH